VAVLRRYTWLTEEAVSGREWVWLMVTPLTGGLAAALPLVLVAGAVVGAVRWPASVAVPVGLVLVILAVAIAPLMIALHVRWTRDLLGPAGESWWYTSGVGPAVNRSSLAARTGARLAVLSVVAFAFGLLQTVALVLSWGRFLPWLVIAGRPFLDYYRRQARGWTNDDYASPYHPVPEPTGPDADGRYRVGRSLIADRGIALAAERRATTLTDPATWRDLLWMVASPWLVPLALLPVLLIAFGFFGLVLMPPFWMCWSAPVGIVSGDWVQAFYLWSVLPFDAVPGFLSPMVGLALTAVGLLIAPPLLRLRRWWDGLLLRPTAAARLAQRIQHLTESRADALDTEAAELRRIERDLHDGAQARLVSVGLSLGTVERLLETDPDAARALLAHARESSATALTELRNLVRGIHPPVLAERGLADAVRAVALDCPVPVDVTVSSPRRLEAPVESAAYFAVCEILANAIRHGGANRVSVDLAYGESTLTIVVRDDGQGGADPVRGTGLRGIIRRLGAFDGVLHLQSPPGGPTVVTMEIPHVSSSSRTSAS
jgi:hypothetical protein